MEVLIGILIGLIVAAVLLYIAISIRRRRAQPRFIKQTDLKKQQDVKKRATALTEAAKDPAFREQLRRLTLRKEYLEVAERKAKRETALLSKPNVVGVAIGERGGKPVISVFVDSKAAFEELEKDHELQVVQTGKFTLSMDPIEKSLETRMRPVVGGASISHVNGSAGTLAICCFQDHAVPVDPGMYYLLSNSHVLTNNGSADPDDHDAILQPGKAHGGKASTDIIGWLTAAVPVQPHPQNGEPPCNYVDAAIAAAHFHDVRRDIYWTGHVLGCDYQPAIGDVVQKTGSNTGFTMGRITHVDGTIDLAFGGQQARFCHQIIYEGDSFGGDSGSLLVNTKTRRAVGLVFARATDNGKKTTLANHLLLVEHLLQIRIAHDGGSLPAPPIPLG